MGPIPSTRSAWTIWAGREEMGMAPRPLRKGAQAAKEWARAFAALRTWANEIHEKDKISTLMSLMILEIDQWG